MKRILVCDDDAMIVQMIERRLTLDGYSVITASDGEQAEKLIASNKESLDLILTDMHMPHVTGMELIDLVRNDLHQSIPIIVLTKDHSEDTHEDAYDLGANEYLTKPVNPNILSIKVKRLLGTA